MRTAFESSRLLDRRMASLLKNYMLAPLRVPVATSPLSASVLRHGARQGPRGRQGRRSRPVARTATLRCLVVADRPQGASSATLRELQGGSQRFDQAATSGSRLATRSGRLRQRQPATAPPPGDHPLASHGRLRERPPPLHLFTLGGYRSLSLAIARCRSGRCCRGHARLLASRAR